MSKKKSGNSARRAPRTPETFGAEILAALERADAPLTHAELRAALDGRGRERAALARALAELESAGKVVRNRAGSLLVAKRIAVSAGRIEGHRDGHGLLIPDHGGAAIFLPPVEMRQVMHGDRATVRVQGEDPRGRPAGSIVEVLARANRHIVGRLQKEHGVLFLVPEDRRMPLDILIDRKSVV